MSCRAVILAIALALWALPWPAHTACAQWMRVQTAHVGLSAPRGYMVQDLLDELDRAYRDVRAYGLTLPQKVECRTYASTSQYAAGSGGPRFTMAMAVGTFIHLQPLPVLRRQSGYTRSLRHEMAHVALYAAARHGLLPRWLNEGLAMNVAGESLPLSGSISNIETLEKLLTTTRTYDVQRRCYAVCGRLCAALIAQYGKAGVILMVRRMAGGTPFADAFRAMANTQATQWANDQLKKIGK